MVRPMRVLVLEPHPNHGGGSEAVSLDLSAELSRRGHEIVLLHDSEGTMLPRYRAFASAVVRRRLPGFARRAPLRTLASVTRLGAAARAARADVILSSHLGFIRHAALVRLAFGVPACFHLGLPSVGSSPDLRLAYGRIGAGVAPSAHTRDGWLRDGWPGRTLHVIPNWVDSGRFAPATDRHRLRAELQIPDDARCLLYVGRLSQAKGVEVLLHAFARLDPGLGKINLVLVGNALPEYMQRLELLIGTLALPAGRCVLVRPATATPEHYYAAADLACVPSVETESFGLALIEAMSSALPVVATSGGVIPQILGAQHADLLALPGDADSLAARINTWLAQPTMAAARGSQLRQRVLEQYTAGRSADAYEAVLAGLARR
jgi:glycosyltransferase involved in cell wall biosynthesis